MLGPGIATASCLAAKRQEPRSFLILCHFPVLRVLVFSLSLSLSPTFPWPKLSLSVRSLCLNNVYFLSSGRFLTLSVHCPFQVLLYLFHNCGLLTFSLICDIGNLTIFLKNTILRPFFGRTTLPRCRESCCNR